jgi:hypothetical protein
MERRMEERETVNQRERKQKQMGEIQVVRVDSCGAHWVDDSASDLPRSWSFSGSTTRVFADTAGDLLYMYIR